MDGRNVTVHLLDGVIVRAGYRHSGLNENFTIHLGDVCVIRPVNSKKKKHRDRECVVTGKSRGSLIQVKFTDNDKYGYLEDVTDLVLIKKC